eukprot:UN01258
MKIVVVIIISIMIIMVVIFIIVTINIVSCYYYSHQLPTYLHINLSFFLIYIRMFEYLPPPSSFPLIYTQNHFSEFLQNYFFLPPFFFLSTSSFFSPISYYLPFSTTITIKTIYFPIRYIPTHIYTKLYKQYYKIIIFLSC